jgi:hypothetical protein
MKYEESKRWLEEIAEKYKKDKEVLDPIQNLQLIINQPLIVDSTKEPPTVGRILSSLNILIEVARCG